MSDEVRVPSVQRWLELEGLDNVRDVGGLPLRGGGTTRSGVLLRSASLHFATPQDVRFLVDEFGLALVLDLRTPGEIERDGPTALAAAGVETVPLTFIGASREALPETGDDSDPLLRNYLGYLTDHPANVVEAVRRLAAQDVGSSLVHCAAGKDRTGVLVALVLDAVGVERDAIVADYVLTATRLEAMFRRWTSASDRPMPADLTPHMPRAEVMAAVLARLDAQFDGAQFDGAQFDRVQFDRVGYDHAGETGGAAGWLRANGLDDAALSRLRERLGAADGRLLDSSGS